MLLTHSNLNVSHQLSPALFCLSRNPPISCSSCLPTPQQPFLHAPAPLRTRDQPGRSRSAWDADLSAVHSQSTALKEKMRTEAAGRSFLTQGAGTHAAHPSELIFQNSYEFLQKELCSFIQDHFYTEFHISTSNAPLTQDQIFIYLL